MVSVNELDTASPATWRAAADDVLAAAKHCEEVGSFARDEVAATLRMCWRDVTGEAARRKFIKSADDYEAAAFALRGLTRVYDTLADEIEKAQRTLHSALDYARAHDLDVDDSGRVQRRTPTLVPAGERDEEVLHAKSLITEALEQATAADTKAAEALRTINGLATIEDPGLVKQVLAGGPNNPLAIALRLTSTPRTLHDISVSPAQLAAVERASRETGISRKLLLAILWQEQQWYQNFDRDLKGPVPEFGRIFDWTLQQTIKPDKSLGITHMKIETARSVIALHRGDFTVGGTYLGDLDDTHLAKYIEERPNENVRLSAYYLKKLREDSAYGSRTDKQLFMLYAADTPQVREANELYGDESDKRGGAILHRAENWDRLSPHLDDAQRWDNLSEKERTEALRQLASQSSAGQPVRIDPIYGADAGTYGTGKHVPGPTPSPLPSDTLPQEPRTPSPEPNASPTPPGD